MLERDVLIRCNGRGGIYYWVLGIFFLLYIHNLHTKRSAVIITNGTCGWFGGGCGEAMARPK